MPNNQYIDNSSYTNNYSNYSFDLKNFKDHFVNMEIGDMSDGYHTFNELYHHRAVLFSIICNQNPRYAWKSKCHSDGTMYTDMFVVGIDLPIKGSLNPVSYHYNIDPYWDMFSVKELPRAPAWDGYTPWDVVDRLERFSKEVSNNFCFQIP